MKTFKTTRETAVAALAEAIPLANRDRFEYGGLILKTADGFSYTPPITIGKNNTVSLQAAYESLGYDGFSDKKKEMSRKAEIEKIKKLGVVSTYHVHLCGLKGSIPEVFSFTDMMSMLTVDQDTSYIGVACSGTVYESTGSGTAAIYFKAFNFEGHPDAGLGKSIGNIYALDKVDLSEREEEEEQHDSTEEE